MKNISRFIFIFIISACATGPNVKQGENPGHDAIVIVRINLVPENSPFIPDDKPVYQQVRKNPLWGPIRQFEVDKGNPFAVTTLEPGIWEWFLIKNIKFNGPYDNKDTQAHFRVKSGCINYLADITVDMSGRVMKFIEEPPNESTLNQFKLKYPKMFAANSVCQNVY
jgi:hypothetical protein